ncbi:hypothetical protein ETU10_03895 [Apibacter muscae]|uniref:LIC11966 family surface protein n=1 Tax=Apibacter muscae TaxID=2509004 RepID=UPI0011ACCF26|nr:hypothetical protein [Apibacter muscae]TWP24395.1 hypothetical protein ETU10_03895 [Apibacter muscae]
MKKLAVKFLGVLSVLFLMVSCSGQNPVEYNNKIMNSLNKLQEDQKNMNSAMTSNDLKKAEEVRAKWEGNVNEVIKEITKIGDFKGDSSFKDATLKSLNQYKEIITVKYKELIDISSKEGTDSKQLQLLNEINNGFYEAINAVNDASRKFEQEKIK